MGQYENAPARHVGRETGTARVYHPAAAGKSCTNLVAQGVRRWSEGCPPPFLGGMSGAETNILVSTIFRFVHAARAGGAPRSESGGAEGLRFMEPARMLAYGKHRTKLALDRRLLAQ